MGAVKLQRFRQGKTKKAQNDFTTEECFVKIRSCNDLY